MRDIEVAVIGAGMAGLSCARALVAKGMRVKVFDKGRGPGGRMSTRRGDGYAFDHGAQYFTARERVFAREVDRWVRAGVVAPWSGRFGRWAGKFIVETPNRLRFVGTPRMSALTRHLSQALDLVCKTRIGAVDPTEDGRWRLIATDGSLLGDYDRVVVATPAPQAVSLLAAAPEIAERAEAAVLTPSWAVMARLDSPSVLPFDGADVQASPVAWAARNNSKPGRGEAECWVLHATPRWSFDHVEADFDWVARALVDAFAKAVGRFEPVEATAHRWRYALVRSAVGPAAHLDPSGLGACGDWCVGPRIEGAWSSGQAMARAILGSV